MSTIGSKVRTLRQARGLTQEQLAAVALVDVSSLSRFESGLQDVRAAAVVRLAASLGVNPSTLFAESDMNISASTGLLDLAGAAATLGTQVLNVQRLVARTRLRAVRLGVGNTWRLDVDVIRNYVAAGAADFDMPLTEGPWFRPIRSAPHFPQAIIDAAGEQVPAIMPAGIPETGAVPIKITPAVSAVIMAKPSIIVGETRYVAAPAEAAFGDWRIAYLVERVRGFALEILGLADASTPLARLYSDPDSYLRVVGEAVQRTLAGSISFGKVYAVTDQYGQPASRRITFELPHAALAPSTTMSTVLGLAF
ncbi:MAG: helix-turn-helix transcriptional regulator [Planctomycetota bacterium]|nr:helix-turn-helix transcriptional regulator [Planctomycetota bacterium]